MLHSQNKTQTDMSEHIGKADLIKQIYALREQSENTELFSTCDEECVYITCIALYI